MHIRCLIIDDKPLAIDLLAEYTRKIPFLELIMTTTNPVEGLSIVREQQIDLIFLDMQMPELTGLEFIKIAGKQCKVILITAYAKYALEGFEHDVVDYLLKPVAFDRFYRAAGKALKLLENDSKTAPEEKLIAFTGENKPAAYLFIKTEHRIQKVNLSDILFVEGLQNYIALHTTEGRILSLQPLKKIQEQLPPKEFVRVHKSYIVSLRHIATIERGRISIGDNIVPVGDNYREKFYQLIDTN